MNSTHKYEQLIEIFDGCFADDFNTRLIKGDDEPIYLPADAEVPYNRIVFAHGFYASGLHEISHWCIAGKARRELVDFGYWHCLYRLECRDADGCLVCFRRYLRG